MFAGVRGATLASLLLAPGSAFVTCPRHATIHAARRLHAWQRPPKLQMSDSGQRGQDSPPSGTKQAYIPSVSRKAMGTKSGGAAAVFVCTECGQEHVRWVGRCLNPQCQAWNTVEEFQVAREAPTSSRVSTLRASPTRSAAWQKQSSESTSRHDFRRSGWIPADGLGLVSQAELYDKDHQDVRIPTGGDTELSRVLGGGIVPGSLTLLGGEPGIGKSTLIMQLAGALAKQSRKLKAERKGSEAEGSGAVENLCVGPVVYISGEESVAQVSSRAVRLGIREPGLLLFAETDIEVIIDEVLRMDQRPMLIVIDSIQTMRCDGCDGTAGSVSMVKAVATRLVQLAKGHGVAVMVLGHVTKTGDLAGPQVLSHMVDCVLQLEGDRLSNYRLLRGIKNRYGPSQEMGVYEMAAQGLVPVLNPSAAFLTRMDLDGDERAEAVDGCAIVAVIEGSKPLLAEVQSLVTPSRPFSGRRAAEGISTQRLHLILAMLEKRLKYSFVTREVFLNLVGGLKLGDTALDLSCAAAVMSSYTGIPVRSDTVVFGELGLGGELRPVQQADRRVAEAAKYGFARVVAPREKGKSRREQRRIDGVEVEIVRCKTVAEAMRECLMRPLPSPTRRRPQQQQQERVSYDEADDDSGADIDAFEDFE